MWYQQQSYVLLFVSIPIGFSNELQLVFDGEDLDGKEFVSIPIGFSNELQLKYVQRSAVHTHKCFNPYRVFQ